MTSHEYAQRLQQLGDFLLSRPEFDAGGSPHIFLSFYNKDKFLPAVKALGAGTKEFTTGSWPEVVFKPTGADEIKVSVPRDKVCHKVQDAVWECEPLLSAGEIEQIGVIPDTDTKEELPF
jgi:hypothetical protein